MPEMCRPQDPLHHSGDPPFSPCVVSMTSVFHFSEKNQVFRVNSLRLWQNFSSQDTNFSNNLFPRPQFFKKICFLDHTFENLGGTYLPKNMFLCFELISSAKQHLVLMRGSFLCKAQTNLLSGLVVHDVPLVFSSTSTGSFSFSTHLNIHY